LEGNSFFCEIAQRALLSRNAGWDETIKLTSREKKIINMLQQGDSVATIASKLAETEKNTNLYLELLAHKINFYKLNIVVNFP